MNDDADIGTAPAWPELPEGRPRTMLDLAAAKLRAALQESPGYVLVTADNPRASEALFLRIEPELATFRSLRVSGRTLDPEAVVAALWKKIEPKTSPPRAAMRILIDRARASGHPIIVAIADADEADAAQLEKLRVMLEVAPDASEIVRIALLGGPGLVELLRKTEARAVAVRIGASVNVPTATSALANAAVIVTDGETKKRLSIAGVVGLAAIAGVGALVTIAVVLAWMSTRPALQYDPATVARKPEVTPPTAAAIVEPTPTPPPTVAAAPEPTPAPQVVEEPTPPAPQQEAVALAPAPPVVAEPEPEAAPVATIETPEPAAPPVALLEEALQVGAFRGRERAEALRKQLEARFPHVTVSPIAREGQTLYRVRIGGFRTEQDMGLAAAALRTDGYQPMRVRP